ncbi:hypothetical protein [Gelatiniphilus marinus]|uniref:NlpE C-terminal OB domain-containing protein n=1 Tax=Gelatiniphilus marinus TaxID=1759464 RepID=A0ABW5JX59_9FLAO
MQIKKIFILLLTLSTFISCKKEGEILIGEFVYYADAAVLQTEDEIYGVIINPKVDKLNQKAKAFKKEPTDFVQVEIRGKITKKPEGEEGWDNRVEIKEILSVTASKNDNNNLIKLGKE